LIGAAGQDAKLIQDAAWVWERLSDDLGAR
jgi:hypothetical protein